MVLVTALSPQVAVAVRQEMRPADRVVMPLEMAVQQEEMHRVPVTHPVAQEMLEIPLAEIRPTVHREEIRRVGLLIQEVRQVVQTMVHREVIPQEASLIQEVPQVVLSMVPPAVTHPVELLIQEVRQALLRIVPEDRAMQGRRVMVVEWFSRHDRS